MTTEQLISYYADLLVIQYAGKPKAYDTIKAFVDQVIMNKLALDLDEAFDLDEAIWVQLDTLGKYAGVTRNAYISSGFVQLSDSDFRQLIRVAIVRNASDGTLSGIQDLLNTFFPGQIFLYDYQNMRFSYLIDSDFGSLDLILMFIAKGLLPKPMGVQLSSIIYAPDLTSFYGFRTYDAPAYNASPMNTYGHYQTDRPWLTYADAAL